MLSALISTLLLDHAVSALAQKLASLDYEMGLVNPVEDDVDYHWILSAAWAQPVHTDCRAVPLIGCVHRDNCISAQVYPFIKR